ncbi:MAG: ABC transporter ATP-binding protein [Erysipelotrichaceae bacterium]
MNAIEVKNLAVGYDDRLIIEGLNVSIPKGKITAIIGANGCGKSTLLKTIAQILTPSAGVMVIDGIEIQKHNRKAIAKKMAVLPQSPQAPTGMSVEELVSYGRFPHQIGLQKTSQEDLDIVKWAIDVTGLGEFATRDLHALSGGQRQRAWIAMALAQKSEVMLLDEPTTYLDLSHQLDILQLLAELNKTQGRTIVMVIHELNNAARFADHMIGMKDGAIVCEGDAFSVMTSQHLETIFGIDAEVLLDPRHNRPVCVTYDNAK